jgi:predicted nucleic acid-binding protein
MATPNNTPIIIADSSALVALAIETDAHHADAVATSQTLSAAQHRIIVPADVFSESVNLLGKMSGHESALRLAHELLAPFPNSFEVIDTSPTLRRAALERFGSQARRVSYTDCVVMACADEYGTRVILGWDEAFTKNGYHFPGLEAAEHAA